MNVARPGPGRRADAQSRRRPDGTAVSAVLLVALAVVAVLLTPSAPMPHTSDRMIAGALVTRSVSACPDLPRPKGTTTRFVAGLVPVKGLRSQGTLRAGPVGTDGSPLGLTRGQLVKVPGTGGHAPVLRADGEVAAGLFGSRSDSGKALAEATCSAPRASWWFTGPGAGLGHTSTLVMANVDPGPAVVDVRVFGPDGKVDTIGTLGITIAPGTRQTLNLADVAPQTDEMALQVQASRGRVVAAVADTFAPRVGTPTGSEWVPDQTAPSRVVRLAGLPQKATSRTLLIGNPSDLEAIVEVQVSGRSGTFTPVGLGEIRVGPGAVESTDLTKAVGDEPVAVLLRSGLPVTATVRSTTPFDSSYAAPVVPLVGRSAAPVVPGADNTVQLTAGDHEASAMVRAYDARGHELAAEQLVIKAKTTSTWVPGKAAAYVVVTPGNGSVSGAVSLSGAGVSQIPLVPLPIRFQRPTVLPAPH
jgi:Family of unknown function (DUF5719)